METSNVQTFFSGLKATLENTKQFQKANSLEYAFEFNPLIHFYDIGENKLSEMLAFFLNPNQKHGQGDIFLKSFIELDSFNTDEFCLKQKIGNFKNIKIYREKQTIGQRRLDILLEFDGRFAIGIENKIWADDQFKQLKDYNDWLDRTYNGNYILIYLTPYGKPPKEKSIEKEDLIKSQVEKKIFLLDHANQFLQLLNIWEQKSKADKVRHFFKDFQQLFNHKFKGNIYMSQQKTISDFILEKPKEYLETSLVVYKSMGEIINSIINSLKIKLEFVAELNDLKLHYNLYPDKQTWPTFTFSFLKNPTSPFVIGFQWHNYTNGIWGFIYNTNDNEIKQQLVDKFGKLFGAAKPNSFWPWYSIWYDYEALDSYKTLIEIQDEKFEIAVDKKLKEILEKLNES